MKIRAWSMWQILLDFILENPVVNALHAVLYQAYVRDTRSYYTGKGEEGDIEKLLE
jgi:hypothetical protein